MDNQITDKFEWSESGLQLLQTFKEKIAKIGGERACAFLIKQEVLNPKRKLGKRKVWANGATLFLIANHRKLTNTEICAELGISKKALEAKITRLKLAQEL